MKKCYFSISYSNLWKKENTRVHFCREIVCVKMFLRPFFHVQYDQSVAEGQKYVPILESSDCLKIATVLELLQPSLLSLFCDPTVYQILAEITKRHTDMHT